MALIILVRHGQTDENVRGTISGQGSVSLNIRGRQQAEATAEVLTDLGVSRVLTSPVVRARQTADILAEHLQVETENVRDLREVEYGEWEGKQFSEVRSHPVAQQVFSDPIKAVFPGGEGLHQVQQRGVEVIESVHQRYPHEVIVLVSHGDVIRTSLAHYLGMPFNEYRRLDLDNGAISVLERFENWRRVTAINVAPEVGKFWLDSLSPSWRQLQQFAQSRNGHIPPA